MSENRKEFWNNRRRDLMAKACMNLFQALFIAAFVSEAFLKAAVPWKFGFVVALTGSLIVAMVLCPEKAGD
jgi:Trk K+ transport system NAD-binding subunit